MSKNGKFQWLIALVTILVLTLMVGVAAATEPHTLTLSMDGVTGLTYGDDIVVTTAVKFDGTDVTDYTIVYSPSPVKNAGTYTAKAMYDYSEDGVTKTIESNGVSFTIAKRNITSFAFAEGTETEKTYSGQAYTIPTPIVKVNATDGAVVSSDEYKVKITAGDGSTVEGTSVTDADVYTLTLVPEANGNYQTTDSLTLTFTVKQQQIADENIPWPTFSEAKTYGNALSAWVPSSSDTRFSFAWSAPATIPTVGNTDGYEMKASLTDTKNYAFVTASPTKNVTVPVNKAKLTLALNGSATGTYSGTALSDSEVLALTKVTGMENNESAPAYTISTNPTEVLNAGEYTLTAQLDTSVTNYEFESNSVKYTIAPLALSSVTLKQYNAVYDSTKSYSINDLVDTVTAGSLSYNTNLTSLFDITMSKSGVDVTSAGDVGTYTIKVTAKDNSNFSGSVQSSTFAIGAAEIDSIVLETSTRKYNPQTTTYASNLTATVKSGNVTLNQDDYVLSSTPTDMKKAGEYDIIVTSRNPNYQVKTGLTATYKIEPATVTGMTLEIKESVYNQKEVTLASLGAKVQASDGSTFEVESSAYTISANTAIKDGGEYTITATITDTTNYTGDNPTATYKVTPATLGALNISNANRTYDTTETTVDSLSLITTVSAAAGTENLTVEKTAYNLKVSNSTKGETTIKNAADYTITIELTEDGAKNYSGTIPTSTYTVNKAVVDRIELTQNESTYNQKEVTLASLKNDLYAGSISVKTQGEDFTIACTETIKDAKTYKITATLSNAATSNFTIPDSLEKAYTVNKAKLTKLVLGQTSSEYNSAKSVSLADILKLEGTHLSADANTDDVPKTAYSLTPETISGGKGDYSIYVSLIDTTNFEDPDKVKDTYTIDVVNLDSLTLLDVTEYIYNQNIIDPNNIGIKPVVKDTYGNEVKYPDMYTLYVNNMKEAGDYTITVKLTTEGEKYYADGKAISAPFKVKPATLKELKLGKDTSVYNSNAPVVLSDIYDNADTVLTATTNGGAEIVVPKTDPVTYSLEPTEISGGVDTYKITIKLNDDNNYIDTNKVSADYNITAANLKSLTLGVSEYIYNQEELDPNDLNLGPVVVDEFNNPVEEEMYILTVENMKDAGNYTIYVSLTDEGKKYYKDEDKINAPFTVKPATLNSLTLGRDTSIYDSANPVVLTDIFDLDGTVLTASTNEGEEIIVPKKDVAAYSLLPLQIADGIGTYVITPSLIDTNNYVDTNKISANYYITAANLESLVLTDDDWVYNQEELDPNKLALGPIVKDIHGNVVATNMYTLLVVDKAMEDAGDYTIAVALTEEGEKYYEITDVTKVTADFTVEPAPIETLTLGNNISTYNQVEIPVTIADLNPTLKALGDAVGGGTKELTVPTTSYTMKEVDGKAVLNAGVYTIQPVLNDSNYTTEIDEDEQEIKVTDTYTVEKATFSELALTNEDGEPVVTYRKSGYVAEDDLKGEALDSTVTVNKGTDYEFTLPDPYGDFMLTSEKTIHDNGEYVIKATPMTENYNTDITVETTLTVDYQDVAPIVITINGVQDLAGANRLGGTNEDAYHTISIAGEPKEPMTVVITGSNGSSLTMKNVIAPYTITITGNAITYDGKTLNLDITGEVTYTITANYDDASNLRVGEQAPYQGTSESFIYDVTCKPGEVTKTLMNRLATGIEFSAAEDYKEVSFVAGGENSFVISDANVPKGAHTTQIPGAPATTKYYSTQHGNNYYTAVYTDMLGNKAEVSGNEIGRCDGTLIIVGVDPAPNAEGWIGDVPSLTWTVSMKADGGFKELTHFRVGNHTQTEELEQIDSNTFEMIPNGLTKDTKLQVTITFDDLNGSNTFTPIGYDPKADVPVLTTTIYDGCNVLAGIVEPSSTVRISVNGESINVHSDRWGVFATDQLPLAYEGDLVSISYVDKADNPVSITRVVSEVDEKVDMTAYALGKIHTNAHTVDSGTPKWTNTLNVTEEALKAGRVTLPIIAGNVAQVGEITFAMDESGVLTYSYTLNEGVSLVGKENVVVSLNRSVDDLLNLTGIVISPDGTALHGTGKNPSYGITAQFEVQVPVEDLETTFQTEDARSNELKQMYVDRQIQRPL